MHTLRFVFGFYAVSHHRHAEGAGGGDGRGVGGEGFFSALDVDALALRFFHPHLSAAGTAAETFGFAAIHLDYIKSRNVFQHSARRVINVIRSAEITGIVIGHAFFEIFGDDEIALRQ